MKIYKTIILLFLLLPNVCIGQTRATSDETFTKRRAYELGAGGSQYSNRKPDRYGLLTSHYTGQHQLVGIYAEGAYSMLLNNCQQALNTPGGLGTALGFVYEFQDYIFRLQLGVGGQYQVVRNNVTDMLWIDNSVADAYDYPYHLHYSFYDRTDQSQNIYLQVPVLVGANFQGFYFLVGFKAGLHMWGNTRMRATGSTTATYDQFIGLFEEMDNHGLRKNVDMVRYGKSISLKPSFFVSGEIGYEWGEIYRGETGFNAPEEKDYRIKVALFADFCVNNIHTNSNLSPLFVPADYKWDFPAFQLNHILASSPANGAFVRNLYAGIKVTFLIGVHTKDECIICRPFRSERSYR